MPFVFHPVTLRSIQYRVGYGYYNGYPFSGNGYWREIPKRGSTLAKGRKVTELTTIACKKARCPEGKPFVRLPDGKGLFLRVKATGEKLWQLRVYTPRETTYGLGEFPAVSLAEARTKADKYRKIIKAGGNPIAEKKPKTFRDVAEAWMKRQQHRWVAKTADKTKGWMVNDVFPRIGKLAPDAIEAADVLAILRRIEAAGHHDKAHRVKQAIQRVFAYAIGVGAAKRNPAADINGRDTLTPVVVTHRAAITKPSKFGELLRAVDGYQGDVATREALKLLALTFVRPGELRLMEWAEIDFDALEWRIPASRMKMKSEHVVPLSKQAVAILRYMQEITGDGRYVFPSIRTRQRPLSNNTLNAALRRLGFSKDEHTAHGFRSSASSMLNEQGFPGDVVELQLAHKERNAVRAAYNRSERMQERREMMQQWADYLDGLRVGAQVIPINRKQA